MRENNMILEAIANMYTTKPKHVKGKGKRMSNKKKNKSLVTGKGPYGGFAGYYYNNAYVGDGSGDGGGDGGGGE